MNLAALAHQFAALHLHPGSIAIDATVGNGHDTLFLAERVGTDGHVYGLDIQPQAMAAARRRLSDASLQHRVTLQQIGHEHLATTLPASLRGQVDAITFNLGYLPGGDHAITTHSTTTLSALTQALDLLSATGIVVVTLYPGHPAGEQEAGDVTRSAKQLDPAMAVASELRLLNHSPRAPRLLLIQRVSHCAS